jgi:hypothetical protein
MHAHSLTASLVRELPEFIADYVDEFASRPTYRVMAREFACSVGTIQRALKLIDLAQLPTAGVRKVENTEQNV